jgi:predicted transcriptional regulator
MPASIRNLNLDLDTPDADVIFKALGHPLRLKILAILATRAHTVVQISEILQKPVTTLNQHLNALEVAGLIQTELRPATRGTEKICSSIYTRMNCNLIPISEPLEQVIQISMPLGAYSDFRVDRPCGLASEVHVIGKLGDPDAFLEPDHIEAKALWFGSGFVEYRFPKRLPPHAVPVKLSISMELCSEAAGTNNDYPSDITVWINSCEVGTWTSPGDFGDRRGMLNPDWWRFSQYGHLKTWMVDEKGSSIDQQRSSKHSIEDLQIESNPYITVRIGNKPDAKHIGGVNILGSTFGDHPQDILLRIFYSIPKMK